MYWASIFTNRYSGAVESTSARDYTDVKAWFADDSAEPELVAEFWRSVGEIDLGQVTRLGTSVYNGLFNLLVLSGAGIGYPATCPSTTTLTTIISCPRALEMSTR